MCVCAKASVCKSFSVYKLLCGKASASKLRCVKAVKTNLSVKAGPRKGFSM